MKLASLAACLVAFGPTVMATAARAQQSPAPASRSVSAGAATAGALSDATLRTDREAQTQRRLAEARLKRREIDARRTLGSICKGC